MLPAGGAGLGVSGYWGYLNRRGLGGADGGSGRGAAVGGYLTTSRQPAGIGQRILGSGYWAQR